MPIIRPLSANVVRRQSPWVLPKAIYAIVLIAVGVGGLGWKLASRREPQALPVQATAAVLVADPRISCDRAWQQIVAQATAEIRTKLTMKTRLLGTQSEVAISLADMRPDAVVPLVNAIGTAYVQACRGDWVRQVEQAYSAAQQAVRESERKVYQTQIELESLRDRRRQALAAAKPPEPAPPIMVENPRWVELNQRLHQLEERRSNLLLDRMPLHPSVQDLETRMTATRQEIASVPPKIAQEPPPLPPPHVALLPAAAPDLAEIRQVQQAADRAKQTLAAAQQTERAALAARSLEPRIELRAADPIPPPPPGRSAWTVLLLAVAASLTSLVGLAMISRGAALEPSINSVATLQTLLPVPIVGVVPTAHAVRTSAISDVRRRTMRATWIGAGSVAMLAVAWMIFVV